MAEMDVMEIEDQVVHKAHLALRVKMASQELMDQMGQMEKLDNKVQMEYQVQLVDLGQLELLDQRGHLDLEGVEGRRDQRARKDPGEDQE